MKASDDVKRVLAAIGFTAIDVTPDCKASYTVFKRDNEIFDICTGFEGNPATIGDIMVDLATVTNRVLNSQEK